MLRSICWLILFLLLQPTFHVHAQDHRDKARHLVESIPRSIHGFSIMSGYDEEDFAHIREHSVVYIELVKEFISWPSSDSLFWHGKQVRLYSNFMPILVTSRSAEAAELLAAIYQEAAGRHDEMMGAFEAIAITNVPSDSLKASIRHQEYVMGQSLNGLLYFENNQVLADAMLRYDNVEYDAQVQFFEFIEAKVEINSSAREWFVSRGIRIRPTSR